MTHDKKPAFRAFLKRAGISFTDETLLKTAFTHRSYLNESHIEGEHNERLEFLGDAVLELVVTDYLFRTYPDIPEGQLTAYRAALVNSTMLGDIAEELGMNECLFLSKGEAKDTGRARSSILADTFEAVVGALYMDQGYEASDRFITQYVLSRTENMIESGAWRDAKSAFQEYAQATHGFTPRYEVVRAEGPDHDKHFVVSVLVGEEVMGEGEGSSKQHAEQNAAEIALAAKK